MNVLELFAGSCSFSKVAKERGHNVFTSDINNKLPGIDYYCDILDFDPAVVPFIPDIIWASPDCATWSYAAGNYHYDSGSDIPKTEKAVLAPKHIDKTLDVIAFFLRQNVNLLYYVENPVGRLKKYIENNRLTVPYIYRIDQCQYGRDFKKPTDIFTNDGRFIPKRCPGNCGHLPNIKNIGDSNRKKSSLKEYHKRAMLPPALCEEILIGAENQYIQQLRDMKTEIQISDNQNQVTINGLILDFYPVARVKKTHCNHCWILKGVQGFECTGRIPCRSYERSDKRNGVFSIHEMPKKGGKQ